MGFFYSVPLFMFVFRDGVADKFRYIDFGKDFPGKSVSTGNISGFNKCFVFIWYSNEIFHGLLPKRNAN